MGVRCGVWCALAVGLTLAVAASCTRVKSPTGPDSHPVRAAVRLTADQIKAVEEAEPLRNGEPPRLVHAGWQGNQPTYSLVEFQYEWRVSEGNSLRVTLVVASDREQAESYLREVRELASVPMELVAPEDDPAVAGDPSYGGGRQFIRDNVVVFVDAKGELEAKVSEIARDVDAALQQGPTARSADEMKPVIKRFAIAENPVKVRSRTRLIIDVLDPVGAKLYYEWRFGWGGGDHGGIERDQDGNFYYYADTCQAVEELTLFVLNDWGFCSWSTIQIQVVP